MVAASWEPVHQRLMQAFYEAIQANVERVEHTGPEYDFEIPEGFPPGSKEFFERMAFAIVRVQMESILRNLVDATMTAVAKELARAPQDAP